MSGPARTSIRARRVLVAVTLALVALPAGSAVGADWPTGGQGLQNDRWQQDETRIGTQNVATLAPKWTFTTAGDVSATPAVDDTAAYFPDAAGFLYKVDRASGALIWRSSIAAATGIARDYARATPALSGSTLVIGAQSGKFERPNTDPAVRGGWVLGFDRATGALRWKTRVDDHFATFVTQSAQVHKGVAYVGTASNEEAFANTLFAGQPYVCCSFRGSMLALDVKTGAIRWKTSMVPDEPGYSGAAIWGSTPSIDKHRNAIYVATGNNYSLPAARSTCVDQATTDAAKRACLAGDHFDAIVALDLTTGAIRWHFEALAADAWNTDCGLPGFSNGNTNDPTNCPPGAGPDFDFGQAPILTRIGQGKAKRDVVGAGEKSGEFLLLDRDSGALLWRKQVSPGGLLGGLQWGSAADDRRFYVANSNSTGFQRGSWAALDPVTGTTLWQTADPGTPTPFGIFGYSAQGPVSTANGVVYGCTLASSGEMVAMDAATGAIRWTFPSGSSCLGGAAIVDGTVFWGTGYGVFAPLTTAGTKLYAFTPGGI